MGSRFTAPNSPISPGSVIVTGAVQLGIAIAVVVGYTTTTPAATSAATQIRMLEPAIGVAPRAASHKGDAWINRPATAG